METTTVGMPGKTGAIHEVGGEFVLTHQATEKTTLARERDVMFFPKGTTVKFETPDYALGFFAGHRSFAP